MKTKITKVDQQMTPADKVKRLISLQKLEKSLKPEIAKLKEELLDTMQKQDVLSLKTGSYTLFRAKRITPQVTNFEALKKDLEAHDIEVITEIVFAPQMNLVFKQAIEENKELKGLEGLETEYVSIRIK